MPPQLQYETLQVPVTALAQPWDDIILAGQGPVLKAYDRRTTEQIADVRIFARQAIHGITFVASHDQLNRFVVAWGGSQICLLEVLRQSSSSSTGYRIFVNVRRVLTADDWIFDIRLREVRAPDGKVKVDAVLVTAHNEIWQLIVPEEKNDAADNLSLALLTKLFAGPRCGLYSATLRWLSNDQLLIISGTAFGEIIVWSITQQNDLVQSRQHFVFTGHEGSIFGVRVSENLKNAKGTHVRYLGSCSDDRTIRIWDVSDLEQGEVLDSSGFDATEVDCTRTTGFLNYVSDDAEAASSKLCIAKGMGHLSRIWDIRFAIERQHERTNRICSITSVGEDATCQEWHLIERDNTGQKYELSHVATADLHDGRNIWSMNSMMSAGAHYILTGGADGKIVEHTCLTQDGAIPYQYLTSTEWTIEDVLLACARAEEAPPADAAVSPAHECRQGNKTKKSHGDCFRSFSAIGHSQLLITTNEGFVLLATYLEVSRWTWKRVGHFAGLKGYSISCHLAAEPFEYVLFGDARGNIYYYHSLFEVVRLLTTVGGKITQLIAEILPLRTHEYMSIVVTRHGGQPPLQLRVDLGTGGTIHVVSVREFARWTPDLPQITSAVIATHQETEKGIVVGLRNGSMYSYSRLDVPGKREFDFEMPHVHGKEAVTALKWLPHDGPQKNMWNPSYGWLYSVGRDGTMAIHNFEGMYKDPVLVHKLNLSFGPNLEGISLDPRSLDVFVWGFTSRFFICQNVSAQKDVVKIECGGAHRIWNFNPPDVSLNGSTSSIFAWIKAMKLNVIKIGGGGHRVIQSGGHGREIKACAAAMADIHPGLGPLVATGAEDTNIELSYFADWHGELKQLKRLAVLRKHVTGVQALQWSRSGDFLFSCGGFEEFYVWRLRPVPGVSIGVVCEAKCPLENADSELRVIDFSVQQVNARAYYGDNYEYSEYLIALAYSDSSIRVWKYASGADLLISRSAWSLVTSAKYTTSCLTAASFLNRSSVGWPLVTGSTDGHLAFWSLESTNSRRLSVSLCQSLHQDSIKSMARARISETQWLIATGGDDNSLGFTILSTEEDEGQSASSAIIPSAHAASVNAIAILEMRLSWHSKVEHLSYVVSAGNDQVIRLWKVAVDPRKSGVKGLSVKSICKYPSTVADISSLALFGRRSSSLHGYSIKIVICGVGNEVWTYRNESD